MGLYLFGSRSSYDNKGPSTPKFGVSPNSMETIIQTGPPMPDAGNYKFIRHNSYNGHLLIEINYPDCTNYEGRKILLYKDTTIEDLIKQKYIDPHFSESKQFKSPVARFEPTQFGWNMGISILVSL